MDRFVALEKLPEGYKIPAKYADRLVFDPDARRLYYHGYMSKTDFDHLCGFSRDWSFRRKLEELFQLCAYNGRPEAAPASGGGWLASLKRRLVTG
ncbi:hypothetical protein [Paludisphaera rhizosphaerae]|uniref:hypothetical protein n=1 Tax=Paludisphaera rhizosphaerae TaxID=2711216 RepID=UPI0013E9F8FA|nr:hypothetical protein [Paludisphaera rhizosphaerae]